jgi:hypothetical protein
VTLVALVAIIALAAGGLIVVILAIARDERVNDAGPPTVPRASSDAPSRRDMTERARKPRRRPAWRGITQAWTSWRNRHYLP